jgi:tyrosine-protein phosphatase SIW14
MGSAAVRVWAGCVVLGLRAFAADAPPQGIPNFHQVSARVYRGAQPEGEGWASLAKLGVKTVIDLRPDNEHSCKAEKQAVEAAGMHYVNVPLNGMHAPPNDKISKALDLLTDAKDPVFVHCRRGADRTGTVIACYRITHDGWTNRRALQEAISYGMSWAEFGMQHYVRTFHPAAAPPPPPPPPPAPQTAALNSK